MKWFQKIVSSKLHFKPSLFHSLKHSFKSTMISPPNETFEFASQKLFRLAVIKAWCLYEKIYIFTAQIAM
jgi:hypothetical protein